mgnify:CR=1 FL=1
MACKFLDVCPGTIGRCASQAAEPGPDCAARLIRACYETGRIEGSVLFLCDQKQCGEKCSAPVGDCFHTSDIRHAKNFERIESGEWTFIKDGMSELWMERREPDGGHPGK